MGVDSGASINPFSFLSESFRVRNKLRPEKKRKDNMTAILPAWQTLKISFLTEDLLFPERLYLLLQEDTTGITEWFDDGTEFRINNKSSFADILIPRYFKCKEFILFLPLLCSPSDDLLVLSDEVPFIHTTDECLWFSASS